MREISNAHEGGVSAMAFSKDGKRLVSRCGASKRAVYYPKRDLLMPADLSLQRDGPTVTKRYVASGMGLKERTVSVWEWKNDKKDTALCSGVSNETCITQSLVS